jgi:glycosyltransferase involved in cell wall biosynthesis
MQVMKVCQALTQLGHEVKLLVPGQQNHIWNELESIYGVKVPFQIDWLPSRSFLRKLDFNWAAVRRARKDNSQVVYTRLLWAAVFALMRGLPVILEMHEVPSGRFAPHLYRTYLSKPGRRLTVFITHALQTEIESRLCVQHHPSETLIAPDGVDLERYAALPAPEEARAALSLQNNFTAVYSGGFYAGRGLEILFDLAAAFPQINFLWIGGQPAVVDSWRERVYSAGLRNVTLTGFVANQQLPLYQAAADVLLMPYRQKVAGSSGGDISSVTSPMKLFEYMACGRAILCSDLPVLHEVLNENNAVFYPPDNLAAMSAAFTRLREDVHLRITLGKQVRQDVLQYSWQTRMQRILDFWSQKQ